MASTWFQNGQRIIVQTLNWLQTALSNYTGNRIEDYSQAGICKLELGEFTVIAGTNNTPTTPSVSVGNGVAYDINNLRIILQDTLSYNPGNPSQTTNDGTGNFVSTPQSTGSQNIPLTVNSANYIWIEYLVTVDTTQFTLQDITLAKQFYMRTDGYQLIVTTANVAPSATALFLAGINLTGSGVVSSTTISQLGRTYTGNLPYRNFIQTVATNLSDRTTIYTTGNQEYFLDDHIKAVGTGTVGPQNPHGLSPQDIGLSGASTLQFHQEFLHSPGIVGVSSTVQAQIINITPGFDQLLVNPIPANAVVTSNGISLTITDIPTTTTLQFTLSDAPGTWYIYVDIINKIIARTQVNLTIFPNPNQYLIYTVFYTYPDPDTSNGHLSALTDLRVFGNIATRELQAGSVTGIKINPSAVGAGLIKDVGNNIQVNVDGTSIIINGSNKLQANGAGIAGAGLIATGTVLNVNPDNSTINIISNEVEVANSGITGLQINPSVAGNGLSGGGGSALSVNVDNTSIIISGDTLHVGTVNGGQISDGACSVRQSFTLTYNGGVSTNTWEVHASTGFSVPSTSQPVLIQWYWSGTSSGGAGTNQGVGLAIDNVPLATVATSSSTSWPGSFGLSASTPIPPISTYNASLLVASGTSHTLQMYLHGGPGTGGGSINTTIHVTLMFIYR